jgi:hypothetical protein
MANFCTMGYKTFDATAQSLEVKFLRTISSFDFESPQDPLGLPAVPAKGPIPCVAPMIPLISRPPTMPRSKADP